MKFKTLTLGCKVNQYETHAIENLLRERGHEYIAEGQAQLVVINTCAVTAESGRKSRQAVRRLKAENPGAVVAVCGCYSQISAGDVLDMGAHIVYGSADRHGFVEAVERVFMGGEPETSVDDPKSRRAFEPLPAGAAEGRTRAMLKIQDGCDNFCSYCIIPYARGRVRSLPAAEAADKAALLESEGFKELVLTGIEISSYGKDLDGHVRLIDAVEAITGSTEKMRVRLGSLEPTIITRRFCDRLSKSGRICRHFHLSLQSGCDEVLKSMRRKYDCEGFLRACGLLREYFPNCGITADLIVGFPGETRGQHDAALDFIRRCGFSAMHIFPYSIRPGTAAARMDGQLDKAEKAVRARQAQAVADDMERAFLSSQAGRTLPVLFETESPGISVGHSDNYCVVRCDEGGLSGLVRNVEIKGIDGQMLVGEVV